MARAVRSMIAGAVVDKPMELFFNFICFAAVTQGLRQPLQDQMFSETSWFYLSRYVFLNSFAYSVISGVLADVWTKLQRDQLHEGQFNMVPRGRFKDLSFFQWYRTMTFKYKRNTLWQNHRHALKIMMTSLKPSLVTALLVNFVTLGRFELDVYVVGYTMALIIPVTATHYKLEQGFELASLYDLKDVPRRLQSHPAIQKSLERAIGYRNIWFHFYVKIFENLVDNFFDAFEQMETAKFGTRSLSRVIFGGYTPTEAAVAALRKAESGLSFVPGIEKFTGSCETLLTNNYKDWKKLVPRFKKP